MICPAQSASIISILLTVLPCLMAANIVYTADVDGDILSISPQGNTIAVVSLTHPISLTLFKKAGSSYQKIVIKNASLMGFNYPESDIWRTELLKNHRPQFNSQGTIIYYVDGQFNFKWSQLAEVTPTNPYLKPQALPGNGCTGQSCILVVNSNNNYYAYLNPSNLQLTIRLLDTNELIGNYSWFPILGCNTDLTKRNVYSITNININIEMRKLVFTYFQDQSTVLNSFIFGVSYGYCYIQIGVRLEQNVRIRKIGYEINGDVDYNYQQFNRGNTSWWSNYSKKAQRFTGWVFVQNRLSQAYSFLMNGVFQIQVIKPSNGTYNSTYNFWYPWYKTQLKIQQDGDIKWFDLNNNATIIAYISFYGNMVVVNDTVNQYDYLDNRCYTAFLFLKNGKICMDIMAMAWVLLALSVLFPLFLFVVCILYCCNRNRNKKGGDTALNQPQEYDEKQLKTGKIKQKTMREFDEDRQNDKNIQPSNIHLNLNI